MTSFTSTLEGAMWWLKDGLRLVVVAYGTKKPVMPDWPEQRLTEADLPKHFNGRGERNVGITLGEPAADVDLDCLEALRAWRELGPPTRRIWGRQSMPASHHLYWSDPPIPSVKYIDPLERDKDKATLIELRCLTKDRRIGMQSVAPPSRHPSGEDYRFDDDGVIGNVEAPVLVVAVTRVASACLIARYFPPEKGGRNDAFLALAGMLARAGWSAEETTQFARAIYRVLWPNPDFTAAKNEVEATYRRLSEGGQVYAYTQLCKLIDPRAVDTALSWLGIRRERPAEDRSQGHPTPPSEPETPAAQQWPAPPDKDAFHGLAGEIVSLIEPQCESDPAALLAQVLVGFGNLTRGPYFKVGRTRHHTNEFVAVVGDTAKSRKGTGADWVLDMFAQADPDWSSKAVAGGASTGEGLIEKLKKQEDEVKRLLLVETELARVLTSMGREGNTLSMVMRQAWDKDHLETLVKKDAQKVEGAHLSVIAHITEEELRRKLTTTEAANGFANRFVWFCARRSKLLPDGGSLNDEEMRPLVTRLRDAIRFTRQTGCTELKRDDEARALWHQVYGELSEGRFGLFGAVTNRAEAHVMRFACIYALLDLSPVIQIEHLKAALAFWKYGLDSALYLWGDSIGDPVADEILAALRRSPEGLTRTEIRDLFSRHQTERAALALRMLAKSGRVRFVMETTDGRPTERWFAL